MRDTGCGRFRDRAHASVPRGRVTVDKGSEGVGREVVVVVDDDDGE